jgi:hypothetical protein
MTVPVAVLVGARVQTAMAGDALRDDGEREIDAESWVQFLREARGMDATFTPAIAGASGPLLNLSAMLDGQWFNTALLPVIVLYAFVWMFVWGGTIERLSCGRRIGIRRFLISSRRSFAPLVALGAVASVLYVILYRTLHPLLFDLVFPMLRDRLGDERSAFTARIALYLVFGVGIVLINLLVDYTRVLTVVQRIGLRSAFLQAWWFVAANWRAVAATYLIVGAIFVMLLVGYVALDSVGGTHVSGWRAIAIGQMFIGARLIVRLSFAASAVALLNGRGATVRRHG